MPASKQEFSRLWLSGHLGNRLRVWKREPEIPANLESLVMVRQLGKSGGGFVQSFSRPLLPHVVRTLERDGIPATDLMFNECAPDTDAVLQGELMRAPGGLYLFAWERPREVFGRVYRMRDALPKASPYYGLAAAMLLKRHCTPASLLDFEELLERFPEDVVEFSAYNRHLGLYPNRNTIVWEVRNY